MLSAENTALRERFAQEGSPDGVTADQASCPHACMTDNLQPASSVACAQISCKAGMQGCTLVGASCAWWKLC